MALYSQEGQRMQRKNLTSVVQAPQPSGSLIVILFYPDDDATRR